MNYARNFAPNGRFVKGNQIGGRKSGGGRKRGVSVMNGDGATADGRSDSVKAPFAKKEPIYAKGHTLWVCDRFVHRFFFHGAVNKVGTDALSTVVVPWRGTRGLIGTLLSRIRRSIVR